MSDQKSDYRPNLTYLETRMLYDLLCEWRPIHRWKMGIQENLMNRFRKAMDKMDDARESEVSDRFRDKFGEL